MFSSSLPVHKTTPALPSKHSAEQVIVFAIVLADYSIPVKSVPQREYMITLPRIRRRNSGLQHYSHSADST